MHPSKHPLSPPAGPLPYCCYQRYTYRLIICICRHLYACLLIASMHMASFAATMHAREEKGWPALSLLCTLYMPARGCFACLLVAGMLVACSYVIAEAMTAAHIKSMSCSLARPCLKASLAASSACASNTSSRAACSCMRCTACLISLSISDSLPMRLVL